jgi:hypothetical protein
MHYKRILNTIIYIILQLALSAGIGYGVVIGFLTGADGTDFAGWRVDGLQQLKSTLMMIVPLIATIAINTDIELHHPKPIRVLVLFPVTFIALVLILVFLFSKLSLVMILIIFGCLVNLVIITMISGIVIAYHR